MLDFSFLIYIKESVRVSLVDYVFLFIEKDCLSVFLVDFSFLIYRKGKYEGWLSR